MLDASSSATSSTSTVESARVWRSEGQRLLDVALRARGIGEVAMCGQACGVSGAVALQLAAGALPLRRKAPRPILLARYGIAPGRVADEEARGAALAQ